MTIAPWFRDALDTELFELLSDEVDDLAKLNLLLLMRRERGLRADAPALARALGFHSIEQTEQKLHELAACGLVQVEPADDGRALYALAEDESARRRLAKLWKLVHREAYFTSLLSHLAERSVEEAHAHYQHAVREPAER